jgi:hypothetical protein
MSNDELSFTLDEAVDEVLGFLTGLDLEYDPKFDRYRAITRALNRALRSNALEREWSYYSDIESLGTTSAGQREATFRSSRRPRVIGDDAVRLCDEEGHPLVWAYFLPRDALHKYPARRGLWCAVTRQTLEFSRPLNEAEEGLDIQVPVMREPIMFRLPEQDEDPNTPLVEVPDYIRNQELDFAYPDVVTLRAAYYYAQSDPVMQPRVQTIEAQYKDLMYQIIERDERSTDSPFENEFFVPVSGGDLYGFGLGLPHNHPHSDERR